MKKSNRQATGEYSPADLGAGPSEWGIFRASRSIRGSTVNLKVFVLWVL